MSLEKRIEKIEEKCNIKHRCMLVITVWNGTEEPTKEQSDQYLEHQRESGHCERCSGVCVLDWTAKPRRSGDSKVSTGHGVWLSKTRSNMM